MNTGCCPYCGASSEGGQALCVMCLVALVKYWEQNQVIVDAYVEAFMDEMVPSLSKHQKFSDWLVLHDIALCG